MSAPHLKLISKTLIYFIVLFVLLIVFESFLPLSLKEFLSDHHAFHNIETLSNAENKTLYFGDSVISNGEGSVDEYLSEISNREITPLHYPSYSQEIFFNMLTVMVNQGVKPKLVILPVNLRSFSPSWEQDYRWKFPNEDLVYYWGYDLPFRLARVFKINTGPIDTYEADQGLVMIEGQWKSIEPEPLTTYPEEIRSKIEYRMLKSLRYYGMDLKRSKSLKFLKKNAELLTKHGINHLIYLTPLDQTELKRWLTGPEYKHVQANINTVFDLVKSETQYAVNFAYLLPTGNFDYPKRRVSEHLTVAGKQKLADAIEKQLIKFGL